MEMRNRLNVLNDLGKFMAAFGWVAVGLSMLIGIVAMATLAEGMARQLAIVMGFLVIILGSLSGILVAAVGHVMQVLVGMERSSHTEETLQLPEPSGI